MSRHKEVKCTTLSKWIPHEYPKTVLTTLPPLLQSMVETWGMLGFKLFQCTDHWSEAKGRWSLVRAPAYKFNYSFVLTVLRSNKLETFLFLVYYLGLVFLFAKQMNFKESASSINYEFFSSTDSTLNVYHDSHYYLSWAIASFSLANALIVSQMVVVLVNKELSDGSVNWPRTRRRNLPQYPVMLFSFES